MVGDSCDLLSWQLREVLCDLAVNEHGLALLDLRGLPVWLGPLALQPMMVGCLGPSSRTNQSTRARTPEKPSISVLKRLRINRALPKRDLPYREWLSNGTFQFDHPQKSIDDMSNDNELME